MRAVFLAVNFVVTGAMFLAVSALNLVVGFLLQLVTLPWDRHRRNCLWVNRWIWGRLLWAAQPGWGLRRQGFADVGPGPWIIIANHRSLIDIPLCMGLPLPLRVLGKASLARVPFMGLYLRFSRQILIDAADPQSVTGALKSCQESLSAGISLLIFPEGARQEAAELGTFRRGAFRLAKDLGVSVLPVAIWGTHRIMAKGTPIPQSLYHLARVRVLPPLDPADFSTARKMSNRARANLSDAVEALASPPLERASARYLPAGRWAHGFARGKMAADPAYQRVLSFLSPRSGGRLVDVGCGEGHLLALVRAASPGVALFGVDHDAGRVETARIALDGEERLELAVGDARRVELPRADVLCCLDVLHYLPPDEQDDLVRRFAAALVPGGLLLIRDGHRTDGLKGRLLRWSEQLAVATGRHKGDGVFFRPRGATRAALEQAGLLVELQDCSQNTPFANLMWVGRRPELFAEEGA